MQPVKLLQKVISERQSESTRYNNHLISATSTFENINQIDLSSDVQQKMSVQTNSQVTDSSASDAQAQSSVPTTVQANPGE